MKTPLVLSIVLLIVITSCCRQQHVKQEVENTFPEEVSFYTKDSIQILGDLYHVSKEAKTVLLFHQARSNARGEYGSIAHRLFDMGFNVLAIDQRSGGQLYGSFNRTIASFSNSNFGYCDVYADLEGALDYIIDKGYVGSTVIWGSSYSAALVIKLGALRPGDVDAILAFSPASGDPLSECLPEQYFDAIKLPLLIVRPEGEMEYESVMKQFKLAQQFDHQTYVATNGVHGSSMLVESRVTSGAEQNWQVVEKFLNDLQ